MKAELYLTDEEAVESLLSCVKNRGEDNIHTLVVAVVSRIWQADWLADQLKDKLDGFVYERPQQRIVYKNVRVSFVNSDTPLAYLSGVQPYLWIPLCDNIPAKTIAWLNYRTRVGEAKYWNLGRKGENDNNHD